MKGDRKTREEGPPLNYPDDPRPGRWKEHVGTRPAENADYDGSSTLVRRSWFGRFLAGKTPTK